MDRYTLGIHLPSLSPNKFDAERCVIIVVQCACLKHIHVPMQLLHPDLLHPASHSTCPEAASLIKQSRNSQGRKKSRTSSCIQMKWTNTIQYFNKKNIKSINCKLPVGSFIWEWLFLPVTKLDYKTKPCSSMYGLQKKVTQNLVNFTEPFFNLKKPSAHWPLNETLRYLHLYPNHWYPSLLGLRFDL